ncbi:MAG: hypothetical protein IPH91_10860 [Elusimicrobia bacterium]|nr:hypothetical protein [Elusimicrobiota bacterium]
MNRVGGSWRAEVLTKDGGRWSTLIHKNVTQVGKETLVALLIDAMPTKVEAEDRILMSNLGLLADSVGFGVKGKETRAVIYNGKGEVLGSGSVSAGGQVKGYADRDGVMMAVRGDQLVSNGSLQRTVAGLVAVPSGKVDAEFKALARGLGATFISLSGKVSLTVKSGEVHAERGTRLLMLGAKRSIELTTVGQGGRLYVKGSYQSQTYQVINAELNIVEMRRTVGDYLTMNKDGFRFRRMDVTSTVRTLGNLMTAPAGMTLTLPNSQGGIRQVALGSGQAQRVEMASGQTLVTRAIVPISVSGERGAGRTVESIGFVLDGKKGFVGTVDVKGQLLSGSKVVGSYNFDAAKGAYTATYLATTLKAKDAIFVPLGMEFKETVLTGVSDGKDTIRLSFETMEVKQLGRISDASLSGMVLNQVNGTWQVSGYVGTGTYTMSGKAYAVVFSGQEIRFVQDLKTNPITTYAVLADAFDKTKTYKSENPNAQVLGLEWDGIGNVRARVEVSVSGDIRLNNQEGAGGVGGMPGWVRASVNLVGHKDARGEFFTVVPGETAKISALVVPAEKLGETWQVEQYYFKAPDSKIMVGTANWEINGTSVEQSITFHADGTRSIEGSLDSLKATSVLFQGSEKTDAQFAALAGAPDRLKSLEGFYDQYRASSQSTYRLDISERGMEAVLVGRNSEGETYRLIARGGEGNKVSIQGTAKGGLTIFARFDVEFKKGVTTLSNKSGWGVLAKGTAGKYEVVDGVQFQKTVLAPTGYDLSKGEQKNFQNRLNNGTSGDSLAALYLDGEGMFTSVVSSANGLTRTTSLWGAMEGPTMKVTSRQMNGVWESVSASVDGKQITAEWDKAGNKHWIGNRQTMGSGKDAYEAKEVIASVIHIQNRQAPNGQKGELVYVAVREEFEGFTPLVRMAEGQDRLVVRNASGAISKEYAAIMSLGGELLKLRETESLGGGKSRILEYDGKTLKVNATIETGFVRDEKGVLLAGITSVTFANGKVLTANRELSLGRGESYTLGGTEFTGGLLGGSLSLKDGKVDSSMAANETNLVDPRGWGTKAAQWTGDAVGGVFSSVGNYFKAVGGSLWSYAGGDSKWADEAFWGLGLRDPNVGAFSAWWTLFTAGAQVVPVFGARAMLMRGAGSVLTRVGVQGAGQVLLRWGGAAALRAAPLWRLGPPRPVVWR